ncbi:MAG: nucleotide sugar dehydrogenase [Acidimicrobiia bacterium]|nr:nucleotide sugar dehydrogenase [Acidimicrobiia bacterium]
MSSKEVAVIGTGYVGLTTGVGLASLGHNVVCADIDPEKVDMLTRGEMPIYEEGLEELLGKALDDGSIRFVLGAEKAVPDAEFVFMCLPTPQDDDGSANLRYVYAAASEIAPHLESDSIVINKSTVPVGTAKATTELIGRDDVAVVSNPEFLREGSAVRDFFSPARIVIGAPALEIGERVAELYGSMDAPIQVTSPESAELIKYAANAFLATKLSFANSIAVLADKVGADALSVLHGLGTDERVGPYFLSPGPGWGGSCFPKDTRALLHIAETNGYHFEMVNAAIAANRDQLFHVTNMIANAVGGRLFDKNIGVLGLAFKKGTDDVRDSPAEAIIRRLIDGGAHVRVYDPVAQSDEFDMTDDPYEVAADADAVVVLTEWDEFGELDLDLLRSRMKGDGLVDGRYIIDPDAARTAGFHYRAIGRY